MEPALVCRVAAAVALLWLSGCVQTASFQQLRPARVGVPAPVVAVLPFDGPQEHAQAATTAVVEQLRGSGALAVVDESEMDAGAAIRFPDGSINRLASLDAAQRSGAPMLLTGRLHFVEGNGVAYGANKLRFGEPSVAAVCIYQLTDTRSGQLVREGRSQSKFLKGGYSQDPGSPEYEKILLARITHECALQLAADLAPYQEDVTAALPQQWYGTGAAEVRAGNRAAVQQQWQQALAHYRSALEKDEKNAAAWQGLGVAFEATGKMRRAREAYRTAASLSDSETGTETLARLERAEAQIALATTQKTQARVLAYRPRIASAGQADWAGTVADTSMRGYGAGAAWSPPTSRAAAPDSLAQHPRAVMRRLPPVWPEAVVGLQPFSDES